MPRPHDPTLRARILDAAERLFAADPDASLDDVADAAGASRATVYRRFSSRNELMDALVAERGLELPRGEREDVRERILAAAGQLLPELGLHGATVERIAEQAGVGAATVYRHFGDKEGLLRAWMEWVSPRREVAAPGFGKDLEADLRRLAATGIRFMRSNAGMLRVVMSANPETLELLNRVRSSSRSTRAVLAEHLRVCMERGELRPADPELLAESFFGMMLVRGASGPLFGGLAPREPEEEAEHIVRLFLEGARTGR